MKVKDRLTAALKDGELCYSFEYFPPKTPEGTANLFSRIDRMVEGLSPLFVDLTWGAGGSTAEATLDLVTSIQKYLGIETQMHLTCTNISEEVIVDALTKCKNAGIQNILALRGDPPAGQERWQSSDDKFCHACDLVSFIKQRFGDYFGIAVAGYSEGHLECTSYESDVEFLKQKVDAGGEVIVSQLFYDVPRFLKWVQDCRDVGIDCPILPGILPPVSYNGFKKMIGFCKTIIPDEMASQIEQLKNDQAAFTNYSVHICVEICKELMKHDIRAFHFYTLNQDKNTTQVLNQLGALTRPRPMRALPWRQSGEPTRLASEEIRPVYWLLRTYSYIQRTEEWSVMPKGYWPSDQQYLAHSKSVAPAQKSELKLQWGVPSTVEDVATVFESAHDDNGCLPWLMCGRPYYETTIKKHIINMCHQGMLVTNALPNADGAASDDDIVGWGVKGGLIYQRAYVEFFCTKPMLDAIIRVINQSTGIHLLASDCHGNIECIGADTTAVTWGVFPDSQIKQALVVDKNSFIAWSHESFSLWIDRWRSIYDQDTPSHTLVTSIHDGHWLVSLCDQNHVKPTIWSLLDSL